ncbi:MAG: hypothetical protein J5679_00560 [Alphaproteobacteria bacterium]|nr:hypothetical protein [Alphaproteobacteria bacterium]
MRQEYGRSLIEILGVLAIGAIMTGASIAMYRQIRATQIRTIANAEIEQIIKNAKILTGAHGTYEGLSVDYLVKSGAIKNAAAPLGGDDWSVTPSFDGSYFSINLTNLSSGECEYFEIKQPTWANSVLINGVEVDGTSHCFSTKTNLISFIVK